MPRWDADASKQTVTAASKLMSVNNETKALEHILSGELQAFVQGKAFGLIAYNAAAPTPAETGEYTFSTAGLCSWLTDYPVDKNVVAGDKVLVIYDVALETYSYELVKRPDNVASQMVNDSSVAGASVKHALEALGGAIDTKVDKVAGKSLIADTEITRLSSVTNQTLEGLGGAPKESPTFTGAVTVPVGEEPTSAVNLLQMTEQLATKADRYTIANVTAAVMDTLVVNGTYECSVLNPPLNLINSASTFSLAVSKPIEASNALTQVQTNPSGQIYLRSRSDASVWTPWILIATNQALKADGVTYNGLDKTVAGFVLDARQGKALADADAVIIADEQAVNPSIAFNKHVVADGGTVRSKAFMQRTYDEFKDLLPNADILLFPEAGAKIDTNKLATVYDTAGTNDAIQLTAGSRFYAGNTIAPNEKLSIESLIGMSAVSLGFTDIVKANTDNWTLLQNIKCNNVGSARIYYGSAYMEITATEIILHNGTSAILTGTYASISGQNMTVECRYQAGNGVILVNGIAVPTIAASLGVTFGELTFNASYPFDGNINAFGVFSRAFSAYESQRISDFLSAEFPAIETITVGSQQVATSNMEATVFGGTSVPEVQGANTDENTELITDASARDFSSDTGWWVKGGTEPIISGGVCTIACAAGGDSYMLRLNVLTIGKAYRFIYSVKRNGDGALRNFSSAQLTIDSTVGDAKVSHFIATSTSLIIGRSAGVTDIDIDDLSFKELGWSDAQSIYDAHIAAGNTDLQASIAAAMWCHHNNSDSEGAIYGNQYNGYALEVIESHCLDGFHVPSLQEITQLGEFEGGSLEAGRKLKAYYGVFMNQYATNESGVSLIGNSYRSVDGIFDEGGDVDFWSAGCWTWRVTDATVNILTADWSSVKKRGAHIRLFSNTPHLEKLTYDSGLFSTDIASTPKSIRIPFGCKVTNIKCVTSTSVTAIEAKLFNYAGTELETLITGKACNATTKSFSVTADQTVSYTDNYVRVTAAGNGGNGMTIYVTIEPV